ncbi:MAG: nitroreductase [Pseudomonadales bacterium]|nr:nitroreductase [Pseudomonadales bacterium]|tara:strand:- start:8286 stop:9392 length:1107 start_codon:yes stop_codon:yes gene_type:complete
MNKVKQITERVLPHVIIKKLKRIKKSYLNFKNTKVLGLFGATPFLANCYYFFFSKEFIREHKAVLAGKKKYYESLKKEVSSSYLLRRNIHRLEKGLIMPVRRKVFALDFIGETVDEYQRVLEYGNRNFSENELKWATDVLAEYFDAVDVDSKELLKACKAKFESVKNDRTNFLESPKFTPFLRDHDKEQVDFDAFLELCRKRRSVRFFTSEPPAKSTVDMAIKAALQSPSACNRQPFSFRIFDEPSKVQEVAAIPAGTKTFYKEVPGVIVVVGHLDAYYRERDRHAIYVDGSLAVMSLILAFETLGISSCVINWGDEEPAESRMNKLLNLKTSDRVLMLVAYGYPDQTTKVPFSSKRETETVRTYNEY